MNLAAALQYLFPGIVIGEQGSSECSIEMIDGVPRIEQWNRSEPVPTNEQIAAALLPAAVLHVVQKIKAERDRRKGAGCPVGAHVFHSDPDSRIQQLGLVMMGASMPPGIMWRTVGGAFVEMTPTLAQQIFNAQANRDMQLFSAAESHISSVGSLASVESVLAYDYTTGWPE